MSDKEPLQTETNSSVHLEKADREKGEEDIHFVLRTIAKIGSKYQGEGKENDSFFFPFAHGLFDYTGQLNPGSEASLDCRERRSLHSNWRDISPDDIAPSPFETRRESIDKLHIIVIDRSGKFKVIYNPGHFLIRPEDRPLNESNRFVDECNHFLDKQHLLSYFDEEELLELSKENLSKDDPWGEKDGFKPSPDEMIIHTTLDHLDAEFSQGDDGGIRVTIHDVPHKRQINELYQPTKTETVNLDVVLPVYGDSNGDRFLPKKTFENLSVVDNSLIGKKVTVSRLNIGKRFPLWVWQLDTENSQ